MSNFETTGELRILSLDALHIHHDHPVDLEDSETIQYYKLDGEFFYCDMAVDGSILVKEEHLNDLNGWLSLRPRLIKDGVIYLHALDINNLKYLSPTVQYLYTENFDPEDEDEEDQMVFLVTSFFMKDDACGGLPQRHSEIQNAITRD